MYLLASLVCQLITGFFRIYLAENYNSCQAVINGLCFSDAAIDHWKHSLIIQGGDLNFSSNFNLTDLTFCPQICQNILVMFWKTFVKNIMAKFDLKKVNRPLELVSCSQTYYEALWIQWCVHCTVKN